LHGHRRGAALLKLRLRLAEALVGLGRADDALEHLHFAARLKPGDPAILQARGRLELVTGDLDSAERTLRAALLASGSPEGQIQVYVDLSAIAAQRSDRARAATLVESALELAIDHGHDLGPVGAVLREMGEHALLARALETVSRRASEPLDKRIAALEELIEIWRGHLAYDLALADRLYGQGSIVDLVARAIGDDPTRAEATTTLAGMLERAGRLDEAARVLKRHWLSLRSDSAEYIDTALRLGRVLDCALRPQEAVVVYASIVDAARRRPSDVDALRAVAMRLKSLGSDRLADCLELLSTLDPESAASLAPRLVELRKAQGDEDGLARALELGLREDRGRLDYVEPLVQIYEARGDDAAALRVLRAAARAAPEDRDLLWRLAEANRRAGSDRDSLGLIDVALRMSPTDVELRMLRARLRERVADVDGALADIQAVDLCDPHAAALAVPIARRILARAEESADGADVLAIADLMSRLGLPAEAKSALELVLARDPSDVGALQRLASAAALRQDWGRAADLYERLVSGLDLPSHDPAWGGLVVAFADACQRAGRPNDGREALELALARQPENRAVASELERICEATRAWRRLSELLVGRVERTTDPPKKERLLLHAATVLMEEEGAPDEALVLLERACAEHPDSIEAALERAKALLALGRPNDALTLLQPALGRAEHKSAALRAEILLAIGKAYLALGEAARAFQWLRTGLSLYTRNRELAMLLGVVAHDLGEHEPALRALTIARDLSDPGDVEARVASRILDQIARSRGDEPAPPTRRASGIELKRTSQKARRSG
jgi:tetratricopeptide (TPR) repeat protein